MLWKAVKERDLKRLLGKCAAFLERDGKRKFLLSRGHVEMILLASVNMDNH